MPALLVQQHELIHTSPEELTVKGLTAMGDAHEHMRPETLPFSTQDWKGKR